MENSRFPDGPSQLLTVTQAAEYIGFHRNTVYRLLKQGSLPFTVVGTRSIRIRVSDLDKWLEHRSYTPPLELIPTTMVSLDGHDILGSKGGFSGLKSGKTRWQFGYGCVYVRKSAKGAARFYMDYRDAEGKRVQKVVKHAQNASQAGQALQATVRDMLSATYGLQRREAMISFFQLADLYMENYSKVQKRSWKSDDCYIKSLKRHFGDKQLSKICQFEVEAYVTARINGGLRSSSVNREVACLKKMFNKARDWGYMQSNPAEKVGYFSEKEFIKERILTGDEERLLLASSPAHLKRIILAALNTGMRRAEILTLRWEDVDLEKRLIRLAHTKSGKIRVIPIGPDLLLLLMELRTTTNSNPYVFVNARTGTSYRDIKRAFQTACKKAKVESLRFHDLRHTFASRLVERGVDIVTVKELLGHSTIRMTERYTHSRMDLKRNAVERLGSQGPEFPQGHKPLVQGCDKAVTSDSQSGLRSMFSVN